MFWNIFTYSAIFLTFSFTNIQGDEINHPGVDGAEQSLIFDVMKGSLTNTIAVDNVNTPQISKRLSHIVITCRDVTSNISSSLICSLLLKYHQRKKT